MKDYIRILFNPLTKTDRLVRFQFLIDLWITVGVLVLMMFISTIVRICMVP